MSEASPLIDSHLHLWDRKVSEYAWITQDLGELYADFDENAAHSELWSAGVSRAILVQAEDSRADTRFMLDIASRSSWVIGVVGWVPLEDPHAAAVQLGEWSQHSEFCGVRQLVHIDPRDDLLDDAKVLETLRLVADAGVAFDVPNAWPRHVASVERIARGIPHLTVVVDHLGTPPDDEASFDAWSSAIRDVAAHPNTIAKLSGLQHLSTDILARVWDTALASFGPSRLAYGGDWPMTVPSGGYAATWARIGPLIDSLSPSERADVRSGTALRAYRRTL